MMKVVHVVKHTLRVSVCVTVKHWYFADTIFVSSSYC